MTALQLYRDYDGFGVTTSNLPRTEHKVKDYDIIYNILRELKLRSKSSSRALFVKVHGHSGDPLNKEADRLAVEGANKDSDDDDTLYPAGRGQEMFFNWIDHADKSKSHTWCLTVKKHFKADEEKISWQTRSRKTHAEDYLAGSNAAHQQLGVVKTEHQVGGAEAAFIADAISGMDVGGHTKANQKYREQVAAAKDKARGE